ncbi:uncharacterized protein AAES06_015573 [Glossophaga mutica]
MASPTPMGAVGVIVGNVVLREPAETRSQTTIPDRPRASCVATPPLRGGVEGAVLRPGRCDLNGSRGGLNSSEFAGFRCAVSAVPTPRVREKVRSFRTQRRARRALSTGGCLCQLTVGRWATAL